MDCAARSSDSSLLLVLAPSTAVHGAHVRIRGFMDRLLATSPLPLRHQVWESVQLVHTNFCEWSAAMRTYEHIFAAFPVQALRESIQAGTLTPLPVLRPLLGLGP